MKIKIKYTFFALKQKIGNYIIDEQAVLKDEKTLKDFAVSKLNLEQKAQLVKISCCLIGNWITIPQWYIAAGGKFIFENTP